MARGAIPKARLIQAGESVLLPVTHVYSRALLPKALGCIVLLLVLIICELGHTGQSLSSPTSVTTQPVAPPLLRSPIMPHIPAAPCSTSATLAGRWPQCRHRSCTATSAEAKPAREYRRPFAVFPGRCAGRMP